MWGSLSCMLEKTAVNGLLSYESNVISWPLEERHQLTHSSPPLPSLSPSPPPPRLPFKRTLKVSLRTPIDTISERCFTRKENWRKILKKGNIHCRNTEGFCKVAAYSDSLENILLWLKNPVDFLCEILLMQFYLSDYVHLVMILPYTVITAPFRVAFNSVKFSTCFLLWSRYICRSWRYRISSWNSFLDFYFFFVYFTKRKADVITKRSKRMCDKEQD